MAGHSKWKNIARKKGVTDAARAKIFTKLSREIIVAVREGGPEPQNNARLRDCIAKAKRNNLPSENIKRVIEKAAGAAAGENYESIRYEGYGPSAVAVIVETMTDNRNRTAGDMRHYFDKFGGNLGPAGCVSWCFDKLGVFIIERGDLNEDDVMMAALDAGASDFSAGEDFYEITTGPDDFGAVREALEAAGYAFLQAEVGQIPQNTVSLTDEDDIRKMQRLLDALEDNDDVQNVWHNWDA